MLYHIPKLIIEEENDDILQLSEENEVRSAIFELNENSASHPDSFTGAFFQNCWDIIGEDITRLVQAFLWS